jgi:hypothetical protein
MPNLRMTATLLDKVTGPAKGIEKAIKDIHGASQGPGVEKSLKIPDFLGTKYRALIDPLKKVSQQHSFLKKEMEGLSKVVDLVNPKLGGMVSGLIGVGTGSIAATAGLATFGAAAVAAGASAINFARNIKELSFLSRKTNLPISEIKRWQLALKSFDIDEDTANTGFADMATTFQALRLNADGMRQSLAAAQVPMKYTADILGDLNKNANNTEGAFFDVLKTFDQIRKDLPAGQAEAAIEKLAALLHLPPIFARLGAKDFAAALKNVDSSWNPAMFEQAVKDSTAINKEVAATWVQLDNWANVLAVGISPEVRDTLHEFNELSETVLAILKVFDQWQTTLKNMVPEWLRSGVPLHDLIFGKDSGLLGMEGSANTSQLAKERAAGLWGPEAQQQQQQSDAAAPPAAAAPSNPITSGVGSDIWRSAHGIAPLGLGAPAGGGGDVAAPPGVAPSSPGNVRTRLLGEQHGAGPSPTAPGYTQKLTTDAVKAAVTGTSAPAAGGSSFLQQQRASSVAEINADPALKAKVRAIAYTEDAHDPEGVIESLYNRAAYTGKSIKELTKTGRGGFYGPMNRGGEAAATAYLNAHPAVLAKIDAGMATAASANRLKGAQDQGMPGDPNAAWPGGRISPPGASRGAIYNDWGGGPGGHEGARRFREEQQRQVAAGAGSPGHGVAAVAPVPYLLERGGIDNFMKHSVHGTGEIDVNVHAPPGTTVKGKAGGLFKRIRMNRNVQNAPANAGPEDSR